MEVLPVLIQKEIDLEDNIANLIIKSQNIMDGDVIVIAQKIISKNEGQLIPLSSVNPSLLAEGIASQYQKDPRIVELILQESEKIVRMQNGIIIVQTKHGFVCANAGIDESNVQEGFATLLPENPDISANSIRKDIFNLIKKNVAVIIADTFGRPFRVGQTNSAIGISGLSPILDYAGTSDYFGKLLRVTAIAIADELCGAAELVMKKTIKCPVALVRNYDFSTKSGSITDLIRPEHEDLFR